MYTHFFRLNQNPFSIAPDPRFLFMSERHREALAHLLYGVGRGGGFVLLTGEIGAGKTTICRCFLEQIPANCRVAYIFNPELTVAELLESICDEFRIELPQVQRGAATVKDYVDALNRYLLASHAEGWNNVLIIDEAQNLSAGVLEQLRLLTNLETSQSKLLQIILIGQPELRAMLARPELEQLAQRVIARYHLDALSAQETVRYIQHRLAVAGLLDRSPFQARRVRQIHRLTGGVPRRVNLLCDRALLGAYVEDRHQVDRRILKKAAAEIFGQESAAAAFTMRRWRIGLLGLLAGAGIAAAVWAASHGFRPEPSKMASAQAVAERAVAAAKPSQPAPVAPAPALPLAQSNAAIAGDASDEKTIYKDLAALWDVSLADGASCQAALEKDLHCYRSNRGLALLRELDRPAILTLYEESGAAYPALLTALSKTSATLHIAGANQTVGLPALARKFRGEFTTFWRAPQSLREKIGSGDRGPDVDWLAAQLAKLNGAGAGAWAAGQPYDQALTAQVREFQLAQGLEADGVAGPKTLMYLNSAAGIKEPHLLDSAPAAKPAIEK